MPGSSWASVASGRATSSNEMDRIGARIGLEGHRSHINVGLANSHGASPAQAFSPASTTPGGLPCGPGATVLTMIAMGPAPRLSLVASLASLLLLTGCPSPDVGQACEMGLKYADGSSIAVSVPGVGLCSAQSADFFRSGAVECDNLICLQSPTGACAGATPHQVKAYCSKACVSDSDCFHSETGLVCRQVLLDPAFVASLPNGGAPWLPQALGSNYCAYPAPQ
jgi:hypothetical protein